MNTDRQKSNSIFLLVMFWLYVALPLLWGVTSTIKKAMALFA
jgi:hypothetical protein